MGEPKNWFLFFIKIHNLFAHNTLYVVKYRKLLYKGDQYAFKNQKRTS